MGQNKLVALSIIHFYIYIYLSILFLHRRIVRMLTKGAIALLARPDSPHASKVFSFSTQTLCENIFMIPSVFVRSSDACTYITRMFRSRFGLAVLVINSTQMGRFHPLIQANFTMAHRSKFAEKTHIF